MADFIFLGSKITADGDCSHEIKRHLFLGRKVMTNLDSIFKSRDITLSTKVHLVIAMVSPVERRAPDREDYERDGEPAAVTEVIEPETVPKQAAPKITIAAPLR